MTTAVSTAAFDSDFRKLYWLILAKKQEAASCNILNA